MYTFLISLDESTSNIKAAITNAKHFVQNTKLTVSTV